MTKQVFSAGWQFFDDLEEQAKSIEDADARQASLDKAKQLKADYKKVFSGPEAKRVLADLEKRYVQPDVLQAFYPDGTNTAIHMAVRSTEVRMVKMLLTINKPGE